MTAVFCPCREPAKLEESSVPTLLDKSECYLPLNSLLFCKQCRSIRCSYCSVSEPLSWYCSQCLQETTKLGAREAFNKCLRNCLRCPLCRANAIVRNGQEGSVTVQCSSCKYSCNMQRIQKMTFGAQIMKFNLQKLEKISQVIDRNLVNTRNPKGSSSSCAQLYSNSPDQLPELAPLRAKTLKLCAACGEQLAVPSKHPAQVQFAKKSLARTVLPEFELRYNDSKCYLIAWNRSPDKMVVRIAHLDGDVTVPSELHIPPKTVDGFQAPLFLVFRESLESRQAFMTGKLDASSGPGWALEEASVPHDANSILLFTTTTCGSNQPVGAWMKISIRR